MKKFAAFLGLGALLVSSLAMAAGWSQYSTVSKVEIDADPTGMSGTYLSFTTSVSTNKPACATSATSYIRGSADSVKTMTNLANAAFLSGKAIRVYWDGTCTNTIYGNIAAIEVSN